MKYNVSINVGEVEADSLELAKEEARDLLMGYAESNDGSEMLANSDPIVTPAN